MQLLLGCRVLTSLNELFLTTWLTRGSFSSHQLRFSYRTSSASAGCSCDSLWMESQPCYDDNMREVRFAPTEQVVALFALLCCSVSWDWSPPQDENDTKFTSVCAGPVSRLNVYGRAWSPRRSLDNGQGHIEYMAAAPRPPMKDPGTASVGRDPKEVRRDTRHECPPSSTLPCFTLGVTVRALPGETHPLTHPPSLVRAPQCTGYAGQVGFHRALSSDGSETSRYPQAVEQADPFDVSKCWRRPVLGGPPSEWCHLTGSPRK